MKAIFINIGPKFLTTSSPFLTIFFWIFYFNYLIFSLLKIVLSLKNNILQKRFDLNFLASLFLKNNQLYRLVLEFRFENVLFLQVFCTNPPQIFELRLA